MKSLRPALAPLVDWLETRALREQGLMLAAGVLIGLYLAVIWAWQPLLAQRAKVAGQIGAYENALNALARLPPVHVKTGDPRPFARILTETAPDFGLSIRRIDTTEGGADLTLDDATFDAVVLWLDNLEGDFDMTIAGLQITRRPQPGLVAASLTLKGAP